MDALRRKLNDQRGVSMLMALLLMLVALMVSAVVIAAASGAVSSLRTDRAQEQAALTVTSAAELVRDSFLSEDMKYIVTTTTKKYVYSSKVETSTNIQEVAAGTAFSGFANYAIGQLRKSQTVLPRVYTLHMDDERISDVQVTLSMRYEALSGGQYSYVLTAALESLDQDAPYRMTLTMPGVVDESNPITSGVSWDRPARDYYETSTVTTTIHWTDDGTIQRKEGA